MYSVYKFILYNVFIKGYTFEDLTIITVIVLFTNTLYVWFEFRVYSKKKKCVTTR